MLTLVGAGFACSANTAVTFVSPAGGAGTVSISGGLVLALQLSGGTFSAGGAVEFWFGGVTNPTNIQSQTGNCEQCHSVDSAALYTATTAARPIKTPAVNHVQLVTLLGVLMR